MMIMFGPHRVLYLISDTSVCHTYNEITVIKQSKGLNDDLKPKHKNSLKSKSNEKHNT